MKYLNFIFVICFSFNLFAMENDGQSEEIKKVLERLKSKEEITIDKVNRFIEKLDKVNLNEHINHQVIFERFDSMGPLDGLILPTLLEMDVLLANDDFVTSNLLNDALNELSPALARGLTDKFDLREIEADLQSNFRVGSNSFNFLRSFGGQNSRFGINLPSYGGDRNSMGLNDNNSDFNMSLKSPLFGNASLRNTMSQRSAGGECVTRCEAGQAPGKAIGVVFGGVIGTIVGRGKGTLAGIAAGEALGEALGCAVGCVMGPPEKNLNTSSPDGADSPDQDGGEGGGNSTPEDDSGDGSSSGDDNGNNDDDSDDDTDSNQPDKEDEKPKAEPKEQPQEKPENESQSSFGGDHGGDREDNSNYIDNDAFERLRELDRQMNWLRIDIDAIDDALINVRPEL